ncbi:MAG TPA: hypothetical protein DIT92_01650 [Anaerovibrio sp.]|jgi:peptidoglycan hydrolase CwlO-like protein|nr:hypothetical protein [Anaerovibrio sp.]
MIMKKLLGIALVALMGVFMLSCSNGGGIDKAKEIVQELKDKGANMSVDELKAKLMDFADAIKPVTAKIAEIGKKIEEDPSKALELATEMKEAGAEEIDGLMSDMEAACEKIPAFKDLEKDPDFQKKMLDAMGVNM